MASVQYCDLTLFARLTSALRVADLIPTTQPLCSVLRVVSSV